MALGVAGKSLYFIWVLRFRGGWGGGEVLRDFSVPLSPKSTLQSDRGVPWAPSPLLNRQFLGMFVAVLCCLVSPRNTGRCSDPCCPTRNRPVCINVLFGVRFSSSLFSGQAKIRVRFPHRTRLVCCLLGGHVLFLLCLGAAFSLKICGVLPRPAKICLAFLRPARVVFSAVSLRRCAVFLGFRGSVGRRLVVFLSLSLSRFLFVIVGFWCGHTFSNVPSPSGLTEGL